MTDVIEVTDLRRTYGDSFEAVGGVTFSVRRGELFALLGTNGAGKTSTVEVLEGLTPPPPAPSECSGTTRTANAPPFVLAPG